jgi:hypothetical protein
MPWLLLNGVPRELRDGETIVGNGAQTSWRVASADLMPKHFVVRMAEGKALVSPASPDTVIAVSGIQVPAGGRELGDGDIIDAGSARFVYAAGEPKLRSQSAAGAALPPPGHLLDTAAGVAYPLAGVSTGVGRDLSNAVVVRDPTASRFHAEIRREAGGYVLHSAGSSGTQVNGHGVESPRLLTDGDEIGIAGTVLRFTRRALPPGVVVAGTPRVADDEVTRVETVRVESVAGQLRAAEDKKRAEEAVVRQRSGRPLLIALVVVALGVLVGLVVVFRG